MAKIISMSSSSQNKIIKSHKELAEEIQGKRILHLNSLGKDAALSLEWLVNYAKIPEIISLYCRPIADHPDDDRYLNYLQRRFQGVTFIEAPNPFELSNICLGKFQDPIETITELNPLEYDTFSFDDLVEEIREQLGCDYVCKGMSRYESFNRACMFHKKGILIDKTIYPLGMMSKNEVISLIRGTGIKIHPSYAFHKSSLDNVSWYKYKRSFDRMPEYKMKFYRVFPLLALDKFRYEVLFEQK